MPVPIFDRPVVDFGKISRANKSFGYVITEKLDGTNSQVVIEDGKIIGVGSRSRWIAPGKATDNLGFVAGSSATRKRSPSSANQEEEICDGEYQVRNYFRRVCSNIGVHMPRSPTRSETPLPESALDPLADAATIYYAHHGRLSKTYLLATGASGEDGVNAESDDIDPMAADFLGIDTEIAQNLFYDLPRDVLLSEVRAEEATATLEHLAQPTGLP
ncbi:hypothetical protein FJW06_14995 [Mesorhizobium sp. B4-1-3]|uniref:RNA ligase family protein n=1 Tax=Mesorhizobium sp. B4-1-3 TaxID=2589889 RepID=UPI00112A7667|nr:RNA ligase family protein [Mesorhizobium sp. B4-1-3]TPI12976.1 hypothetical protein FJW06_14995 [Mesorhizobium sp. B4-1-3]